MKADIDILIQAGKNIGIPHCLRKPPDNEVPGLPALVIDHRKPWRPQARDAGRGAYLITRQYTATLLIHESQGEEESEELVIKLITEAKRLCDTKPFRLVADIDRYEGMASERTVLVNEVPLERTLPRTFNL